MLTWNPNGSTKLCGQFLENQASFQPILVNN